MSITAHLLIGSLQYVSTTAYRDRHRAAASVMHHCLNLRRLECVIKKY